MGITITFQQGGMREFERTGIYPEYLIFNLPGTRYSWRIRIKEKPQEGVLKSKGKSVYHYSFDGDLCKTQTVNEDGSLSNWIEPEIMMFQMCD
jgi:hypothetical protein